MSTFRTSASPEACPQPPPRFGRSRVGPRGLHCKPSQMQLKLLVWGPHFEDIMQSLKF